MTTTLMIGLLIPLLGTMLGSAFVFFMKDEMSAQLQKSLLGFASGVMVAADARLALHARLCRRGHVLCGGRGTHPRSLRRSAQQPQHHRLCHRFRADDGA